MQGFIHHRGKIVASTNTFKLEILRSCFPRKLWHLRVLLSTFMNKNDSIITLHTCVRGKVISFVSLSSVTALEARFGNAHQAELHKMELRSWVRRLEKTLAELSEDIEYLIRLAYPDATPAMQESLAQDQCLLEEDMRLRVWQVGPNLCKVQLN